MIGIEKKTAVPKNWNFNLHIAIAPTKNIARTEWFIEKATEIGIDQISLILTEHSERRKVRMDRLEKLLLSAMKQSLKAHKPKLSPTLMPFKDFIDTANATHQLIAYLGEGVKGSIRENYSPYRKRLYNNRPGRRLQPCGGASSSAKRIYCCQPRKKPTENGNGRPGSLPYYSLA